MNTIHSIYIPNVHNKWTRSAIINFIRRENLGIVKRIDFTDIILADGSKKPNFKSAFIFFVSNNPENPLLNCERGYRMYPKILVNNDYICNFASNGQPEYWIALPNKSVVPDCNETLHMIADRFNACYELFRIIPETDESKKEFDIYIHDCSCLSAYQNANYEQLDIISTNNHQLCHNSKLLFERLVTLALVVNNFENRDALRGVHPYIDQFL